MPVTLKAVVWVLTCLLVGACAQTPKLSQTTQQLPSQVSLPAVPFYPQEDYQCGPAALATMLGQRGSTTTPEQLVPKVYLPKRKGSLQVELVAAARSEGFLVYPLAPNLDALLQEVAAGNPVLVLQNLGLNWWPVWHFAVAVGYDLQQQQLLLRSGTEKQHWVDLRAFEKTWSRGQRWAVLTLPSEKLPQTARADVWLHAASDLEQVGQTKAALQAYQKAVRQWPNEGTAWFALGNQEYALGNPVSAVQALQRSVQQQPDLAAGWYNLGWVLGEGGCQDSAQQAIACAQQLSPTDLRFQQRPSPKLGTLSCPVLPTCPKT